MSDQRDHPPEPQVSQRVTTVAVCIATYHRPGPLRDLLAGIADQVLERPVRLMVSVADNDPAGSAKPVVDRAREELGLDVVYVCESRQGVSFARNAAVAQARGEFVVFIDDDEVPAPGWIEELLTVQERYDADVVHGPVHEVPATRPSAWYDHCGGDPPPDLPDGAVVGRINTGNTLVRAARLREVDGPFDERFNRSGGEDTLLSLTLAANGCSFRWARHASATTIVPADRLTLRFNLRRAFVGGSNYSRAERAFRGSANKVRLVTGTGRVLKGLGLALVGAVTLDRVRLACGAMGIATGVGVITGAVSSRDHLGWW
jgi:succinoglycan biosynthesis protein ExoM